MNRLRLLIAQSILFLLIAESASAQALPAVISNSIDPINCNFTTGWLKPACVPIFIGHLITLVFSLVGVFFIFNVMYAGYQIAIGAFSGDKITKGKDRLIWSIIGLIVCASAFLILDVILTVIVG